MLTFFLSVMTNNQTKCGIIYEKIAMLTGNDERMINYDWPLCIDHYSLSFQCHLK